VDTAPKASGCILGGTQRIHREEPGKQKTRSCRAQELSRSRAQGKQRRKWKHLTDLSTNFVGPEAEDQQGNARSISGLRTSSRTDIHCCVGQGVYNLPLRVGESVPRQQEPDVRRAPSAALACQICRDDVAANSRNERSSSSRRRLMYGPMPSMNVSLYSGHRSVNDGPSTAC
jgi:hypothetical protein